MGRLLSNKHCLYSIICHVQITVGLTSTTLEKFASLTFESWLNVRLFVCNSDRIFSITWQTCLNARARQWRQMKKEFG